jgi:hypothetical protein
VTWVESMLTTLVLYVLEARSDGDQILRFIVYVTDSFVSSFFIVVASGGPRLRPGGALGAEGGMWCV